MVTTERPSAASFQSIVSAADRRPVRTFPGAAKCILLLLSVISFMGAGQADPVEINAILPLTGSIAILGQDELEALKLYERLVNESGGIKGRPLKFVVLDDQSDPRLSLQLANQIVAKDVPVILGPGYSATCNAVAPMVTNAHVVEYCLSPAIRPAFGGYVFSAQPSQNDGLIAMMRYFRSKRWSKIALIAEADASGQDGEASIANALSMPENRSLKLIDVEHFSPTDLTVSAQLARIANTKPDVIIAWASGTPFGTVIRGISELGSDVVVATSNANTTFTQMEQYKSALPKVLLFPALRAATISDVSPGPIRDAQQRFKHEFAKRNIRADGGHISAWDAANIIVSALKNNPGATGPQLHAYLEQLHGMAGLNSLLDFRDGGQRGMGVNSIVIAQWDADRNAFVAVTKPGGY